jgi:hypothetical protein
LNIVQIRMLVNRKMKPVEMIPGMGGGEVKEE